MNLTEFLLARIAEDEDVAREALHPDAVKPGVWNTEHHDSQYHSEPHRAHIAEDRSGHYWSVAHEVFIPIAEHIARHDPARVLAECEAKRALVAYCTPDDDTQQVLLQTFADPTVDAAVLAQAEPYFRVLGRMQEEALTDVLKYLAIPYADHPDYRSEWAP